MNKTNYNKKYKDRDPLETVQIIKDFFTKYNYYIVEDLITETESTSWYCDLSLYHLGNPIKFLSTHGKGINQEFALASGYAEMYERFSNRIVVEKNSLVSKFLNTYNQEHFNYCRDPLEQEIDFNNYFETDLNFKIAFDKFINKEKDPDYKILKTLFGINDKCYGVPFKNLNDENDIKYHNLSMLIKMTGSNGMSSGNTLEEASVQGISEAIERQIIYLVEHNSLDTYHRIDIDTIKNESIQKMVAAIRKTGNEVYIIDYSYNFNWPVVSATIYNKLNKTYISFWRCHPVFELAVEGAITECYQHAGNTNSIKPVFNLSKNLCKNWVKDNLKDDILSMERKYNFPLEQVFINAKIKTTSNKNCFLEFDEYSNKELLEFYKNLFKVNNKNIYIYETSLCKEFRSIIAYCPEFKVVGLNYFKPRVKKIDDSIQNINFNTIIEDILCNNLLSINPEILDTNIIGQCDFCTLFDGAFKYHLGPERVDLNNIFKQVMVDDLTDINSYLKNIYDFYSVFLDTEYYDVLIKYAVILNYRHNDYTREEIEDIFKFNGQTISDDEWNNCINIRYICKNVIWPRYKEIYSEENLIEILKPYISDHFKDIRNND